MLRIRVVLKKSATVKRLRDLEVKERGGFLKCIIRQAINDRSFSVEHYLSTYIGTCDLRQCDALIIRLDFTDEEAVKSLQSIIPATARPIIIAAIICEKVGSEERTERSVRTEAGTVPLPTVKLREAPATVTNQELAERESDISSFVRGVQASLDAF